MKDTECVEILEDGTVYYFDLEVCNREAEKAIEELHMKQDVIPNFDYTSSIFTIFISSIQILSNFGWTTDELLQEVLNHAD